MRKDYRDPAYIQSLEKRGLTLSASVDLDHSPEELWPYLANTDSLNAKMKLPPVSYKFTNSSNGGTEIRGRTFVFGVPFEYEDLPFEWVQNHYFIETRVFTTGPVQYLKVTTTLQARPEGGTRATMTFVLTVPYLFRLPMRLVFSDRLRQFLKIHKDIDRRISSKVAPLFEGFMTDPASAEGRIRTLTALWEPLTEDGRLARSIAAFVHTAPEHHLSRIRPFELAAFYQLDEVQALRFFLLATRNGYFNMRWDILCPSCQGAKQTTGSLSALTSTTHCETCNLDFNTNMARNVELTFSPTPRVRAFTRREFCFGSPTNTRHIHSQLPLPPGSSRVLRLRLAPGPYRFRSLQMEGELRFRVAQGGQATMGLSMYKAFPGKEDLVLAPELELALENPTEYWQTLKVEHLYWFQNSATADVVANFQDFRDLFGSEVLRPGINLEIANITLLFSDLKDSTRMYDTYGDSAAFSLVQDHFEVMEGIIRRNRGAIVKTIGDAVMGAFASPEDGVRAGLDIQETFLRLNEDRFSARPLTVKLGLHCGPTIMLNLNDKLDYFGSTVNKAARIQSQSLGNEIVISEDLYRLPEVRGLVDAGRTVAAFSAELKGISGTSRLYRIEPRPALARGLLKSVELLRKGKQPQ